MIYGEINGDMHLFFENNFKKRDSISCEINKGVFHFDGLAKIPILARITMGKESYVMDVYLDSKETFILCKNEIRTNGYGNDTMNNLRLISVYGSALQNLKDTFEIELYNALDTIKLSYQRKEIYFEHLLWLVCNYPTKNITLFEISKASTLNSYDISMLKDLIDSSLKNSFEYRQVDVLYNRLRKSEMDIGSIFLNSALLDTTKRLVNPSYFYGKFTLVEFWASWCGPCRAMEGDLALLLKTFSNKGFQVLGVSFDEKFEDWTAAIEFDHLFWPQLLDMKSFSGILAKTYGIDRIPFNYLLNKEGKIIAKNLSAEEIKTFLVQKLVN